MFAIPLSCLLVSPPVFSFYNSGFSLSALVSLYIYMILRFAGVLHNQSRMQEYYFLCEAHLPSSYAQPVGHVGYREQQIPAAFFF